MEIFYISPALYQKRRKEFFKMQTKNKRKTGNDTIHIECDGWRSWERLGSEVLDWHGVTGMYGGGYSNFGGDSNFSVNLYVKPIYARRVYEQIKKYSGTTSGSWTRNFVIMDQFGET